MKRLFIAAMPSEQAKQSIAKLSMGLQKAAHFTPLIAKWVDSSQFHLTFQFIGSTPEELIAPIHQTLDQVAQNYACVSSELRTIGFFPNPKSPNTAWVGLSDSDKTLSKMAYQLRENLKGLGVELPAHSFLPHVTLARFSSLRGTGAFVRCVSSYQNRIFGEFAIDHLALVESSLSQEGPAYTVLERFPLKQNDISS